MNNVDRKTEINVINATPEKRSFWSMISDYDLKTGLCELIDNAIDIWSGCNKSNSLRVKIDLELERQLIKVTDNAGGVRLEDLRFLVTPGGSKNSRDDAKIGVFGVGSKRAVIALGESVSLKTHHCEDQSYQIDITNEWLESPSWELPAYQIPPITEGNTIIELGALRRPISQSDINDLIQHLGEVYSNYLCEGCQISLNNSEIIPLKFDTWAYPPTYLPEKASFSIQPAKSGKIDVIITGGLIRDRIPEIGNYGVYFYCNGRLIVKELKTRDVGYVSSEAGVPHSDASICRVIIQLNGPAGLMPWTSNKTNINTDHPTFVNIRSTIIKLVTQFSKLSRAYRGHWENQIYPFASGKILSIEEVNINSTPKLVLPPIPKVNKSHADQLKAKNHKRIESKPWVLGIIESMAAVDIITRQRLETKNRIALIILDSTFEIALKEYIVHHETLSKNVNLQDLFKNRDAVIKKINEHIILETEIIIKARHYYAMRNKLIHERATIDVPVSDIELYSKTIKRFLNILFDIDLE